MNSLQIRGIFKSTSTYLRSYADLRSERGQKHFVQTPLLSQFTGRVCALIEQVETYKDIVLRHQITGAFGHDIIVSYKHQ